MYLSLKLIQSLLITVCLFIAGATSIQAEEKTQTTYPGMTHAMQKSMDPNVWANMMAMMMNPEKMMSMESCAQCHDADALARYTKDFGPMMEAMKPMMQMANPHMMTSMMNPMMGMMGPMMNPAMYMNMMGPMMGMMGPMMGGMMNPMTMMNPMMYMNMMYPMMGMMGPMMGGMGMPGMPGMPGMHGSNPMGQMMDPKQYEQWFSQWTDMMKNYAPKPQQ